ncbi:MAG: response regulator [Proteobacteria bacterium]|nr:MAG: response regulator [Pseudomonadota bacterium]
MQVTSEIDKGTTFHIYFPRTLTANAQASLTEQQTEICGGREQVLLVEDNPELRELFAEILTDAGYGVTEASDGQEALQLLEKQNLENNPSFDLVVSDMNMPKISGMDLLRRTKEQGITVPFLYVSGYFEDNFDINKDRFYFLQKPFTDDALLTKIRGILDAKATEQPHTELLHRRAL